MKIDLNINYKRFKKLPHSGDNKAAYKLVDMTAKQAGHGALVVVKNVTSDQQDAYERAVNQHLLAAKECRIYEFKYDTTYKQLSGVMYVASGGKTESISVEVEDNK